MLKLNAINGKIDIIFHIKVFPLILRCTQSNKKKVQFGVTNIYYQIIDSSMDEVLKSMTNIFWSSEGRLLLMVMMISSNHRWIWKIIWNSESKGWPTSATTGRMIQMIWIFVTETDYMLFQNHVMGNVTGHMGSHGDGDSGVYEKWKLVCQKQWNVQSASNRHSVNYDNIFW